MCFLLCVIYIQLFRVKIFKQLATSLNLKNQEFQNSNVVVTVCLRIIFFFFLNNILKCSHQLYYSQFMSFVCFFIWWQCSPKTSEVPDSFFVVNVNVKYRREFQLKFFLFLLNSKMLIFYVELIQNINSMNLLTYFAFIYNSNIHFM